MTAARTSGYDAATGICWQFRNKGETPLPRCQCPAHSIEDGKDRNAYFGRCRSGSRWFWTIRTFRAIFDGDESEAAFGWEDSEEAAIEAAVTAICNIGRPLVADFNAGVASETLKRLNRAKRAARPAPDTSDAHAVEYLYGHSYSYDGEPGGPVRYPVIKKTAKRIYYVAKGEALGPSGAPLYSGRRDLSRARTGYFERAKFEAEGRVYIHRLYCGDLHPSFEAMMHKRWERERQHQASLPNIAQLKAEMAAAHPDRGGSNAAFIAARAAYVAARRAVRGRP